MKKIILLLMILCVLIAPMGLAEILLDDAGIGEQSQEYLETNVPEISADLPALELDDPMRIELL